MRRSLNQRPRVRWRDVLHEVLADIEDGVASPVELRYRRDVERRHHLPAGSRNLMEVRGFGGRCAVRPGVQAQVRRKGRPRGNRPFQDELPLANYR